MNLSAPANRRTLAALVAAVAAAALIILLSSVLWGAYQDSSNLQRGFREGFELRGAYSATEQPSGLLTRISFFPEDGTFQLELPNHEKVDGSFEATGDPNHYLLKGADGIEIGSAHLAYATPAGEGLVYVQHGEETFALDKGSRTPFTIEG